MGFRDFIRRQYRVVHRRRVVALDENTSKTLIDQLKGAGDKEKKQELLDEFAATNGITGDDLADLMYDLQKAGYHNLRKPDAQPAKSSDNPYVAAAKAQDWKKVADLVKNDTSEYEDAVEYKGLEKYFTEHPDAYGKFIDAAWKGDLGAYESSFRRVPITKKVLEHVSNDYILDNILYAGLYGAKKVEHDALEYAFGRFKNPVKEYHKLYNAGAGNDDFLTASLLHYAYHDFPSLKGKLDKWFGELDAKEQQSVRDEMKRMKSKYTP